MSADVKYENKYDDEVEERVRKPLEAMIDLPKEERSKAFWKAVGNKAQQDDLKLFLLKAHNEGFYKAVKEATTKEEIISDEYGENQNSKNTCDTLVWLESLETTIKDFQFNGVKFIVKLKENYKNAYTREKRIH